MELLEHRVENQMEVLHFLSVCQLRPMVLHNRMHKVIDKELKVLSIDSITVI